MCREGISTQHPFLISRAFHRRLILTRFPPGHSRLETPRAAAGGGERQRPRASAGIRPTVWEERRQQRFRADPGLILWA